MSKFRVFFCILFAGLFGFLGISMFAENKVETSELTDFSGEIKALECSIDKFSGKPTMALDMGDSIEYFSLFQVFVDNTKCDKDLRNTELIGSQVLLKALPSEGKYKWVYEIKINNSLIYDINDTKSESQTTGIILNLNSV